MDVDKHRGSKITPSLPEFQQPIRQVMRKSLCTSWDPSFIFLFSVSVESCSGSPRSSSLVLPLLSCTGFSVYLLTSITESCGEDGDEADEGVAEKSSLRFQDILQFSCRFWWDVDSDRFSNDTYYLTYTVASLFVRTSPLAVITVVGPLDVLMVANSAQSRSFSLTMCILAQESTTNSLSLTRLSWWGPWEKTFLCKWEECSPVVLFELVYMSGKMGTSLLLSSLIVGPILEFWSVRTSLTRNDFCFSQQWSFLFPDTRLGLSESNFSNCVQDFLHRVSPKLFCSLRNNYIRVLLDTTQLWYAFHDSHNAFVFTFSSVGEVAFFQPHVLLFINFVMKKTNTCLPPYNPFLFYRIDFREDANTHKAISCRLSTNGSMVTFASDASRPRHTSTSWKGWLGRCGGSVFCFLWHDLGLRGGHCTGLPSNIGLFLSTGSIFPPSTPLNPFRFWTTAPVPILPCLASKFRNRSFWSILLFTIVFNFW